MLSVLAVAKRWDVTDEVLLTGSHYTAAELAAPALRVPVPEVVRLVRRTRELTGEPALGVYLGLAQRAASWGYLGFATMSAPTMRAALELGVRFVSTFTTAFGLELRERAKTAEVVLHEQVDFEDTRDVFVLSTLLGILTVGRSMTGRHLTSDRVDLALPRPDYAPRLAELLPALHFAQPEHRLVFPIASLDLEYTQHDPVALRMFVSHCEQLLDATAASSNLGGRIRVLLREASAGFPTLEEAASTLGMSPRTLKRHLATQGVTYRTLLDQERRARALPLVRADVPLAQIATRLGYSNVANFERAFRRWMQCTPAAYRSGADREGP